MSDVIDTTYTKSQMWAAIERLAQISPSVTSHNQRTAKQVFEATRTAGMTTLEPPRDIDLKPIIEADSGKIVSKIG